MQLVLYLVLCVWVISWTLITFLACKRARNPKLVAVITLTVAFLFFAGAWSWMRYDAVHKLQTTKDVAHETSGSGVVLFTDHQLLRGTRDMAPLFSYMGATAVAGIVATLLSLCGYLHGQLQRPQRLGCGASHASATCVADAEADPPV